MTNPNLIPQVKPYLTIIESRRPIQKMHTNIGHAKNAFLYDEHRGGTMWEWKDGEWVLLYTVTSERLPPEQRNGYYSVRCRQHIPWRDN